MCKEIKDSIRTALDEVEDIAKRMAEVGEEETGNNILRAVEYFRKTIKHKKTTEDYLSVIGWAMNIGTVYGLAKQTIPVFIVYGNDDPGTPEDDSEPQVH